MTPGLGKSRVSRFGVDADMPFFIGQSFLEKSTSAKPYTGIDAARYIEALRSVKIHEKS